MAGVLYLFRLFVYHTEYGEKSQANHQLLSLMEQRLLRFITMPAMFITWFCGLSMLYSNPSLLQGKWFHIKLGLVVLLTVFTHSGIFFHKKLKNQQFRYSSKMFRIINEIPTLLMILILGLVVLRPIL